MASTALCFSANSLKWPYNNPAVRCHCPLCDSAIVTQPGSSNGQIKCASISPHLNPKPSHSKRGLPTSDQVLKTCTSAPAVSEVLVNSYPQLRVSESWKEVIPEDVFQVREPPPFPLPYRIVGPCSRTEELCAHTH